jgi:hypothetical protein
MQTQAYKLSNANRLDIQERSNKTWDTKTDMWKRYAHLFNHIITVNNDYFILLNSISEQSEEDILKNINPCLETVTLYQCEFCNNTAHPYTTQAIGQYYKHIYDNHNMHFAEIAATTQPIKNVGEFFKNFDLESYEIDNPNSETATATNEGLDGSEVIEEYTITREFNEYGVPFYNLTIEKTSWSDEIITADVMTQEYEETITEKKAQAIDKRAQKEITKWKNIKPLGYTSSFKRKIELKPSIITRTNYSNITHEKYYKAVKLDFVTSKTNEIQAAITLFDHLIDLFESYANNQ